VTSPQGVDPFASHGKLFEQGKADMYNACEWGNYCRVQATGAGSRQLGRRAIVTYSALVVAADSPVFTPQQLANRTIGVPFYFGTHTSRCTCWKGSCGAGRSSMPRAQRLALSARRLLEAGRATTLTEPPSPWRKGCRIISSAYSAAPGSPPTAWTRDLCTANRAVRRAVRRINADKRGYLHYFIDYHGKSDPEIAALKVADLRESLVVCDRAVRSTRCSAPTTGSEQGMLEQTASPLDLVNMDVSATPVRRQVTLSVMRRARADRAPGETRQSLQRTRRGNREAGRARARASGRLRSDVFSSRWAIFGQAWLFVGHAGQVPQAGASSPPSSAASPW
jgi:NitT/TauT family transport system substrate-binding protein